MSETTKGPRGEKPRGREASVVQVDLYRMLYNADHPLTFDEIAAGMNPAYKHDAYKAYQDDGPESAKWVGHIEGEWPEELKREAWEWWITSLLRSMCNIKRIIVAHKDGRPRANHEWLHVPRSEKVWHANRDKPPMVKLVVWEEITRTVPWTPQIGKSGVRHTKKRRYLNRNAELLAALPRLKNKQMQERLREHLLDGAEALDDSVTT